MKYKFRQLNFIWAVVVFVSIVSYYKTIPFEPYYVGFAFGFGVTGTLAVLGFFPLNKK